MVVGIGSHLTQVTPLIKSILDALNYLEIVSETQTDYICYLTPQQCAS